jgi:fatty-acyl-CoA synthase/long-chain acyl-CoA synthetase
MPLFHYAGILTAVATLCVGGKLVLQERFAPHLTLALLASERATGMVGVPTMYHLMVQVPNLAQFDLSALREVVTGAAPCPPDLIKAVDARMGVKMCNAYGLTESGMLSFPSLSDPDAARIATVGRHMARVELRIVDDQRRSVPAGQPGEIAARTPYALKEYHNRPDATAAVLDSDGWFYTGDVGMLDEQGYLHIMDRKSDMIIRGGINVYPAEIEYFLMTHPGVQMAAIVGVPGSVGGERVWTFIVPKEGATLTAEQILDYCRGQIAAYKVPDEVRFVAELPMTATRKVQKFVLREQAQKEQS